MKQKLLTLTNQYKSLNLSINDQKNWINLFGANYDNFLLRNKGVTIENKEQLLHILNHKPRTLLSSLRVFVKGLINYNSQLQLPTVNTTYNSSNLENKKGELRLRNQNLPTNIKGSNVTPASPVRDTQAAPISCVNTHQIIRGKIQELTQSLRQNKLALPLELLTPLLALATDANNSTTQSVLSSNNSISKTQYSKLINPFKTVNSFEQNISYNFNINNNRKFTPAYGSYGSVGQQQNITTLLEYAFRGMSCLISKPVFMDTPKNLIINLFYFFVPGQVDLQKQSLRLRTLNANGKVSAPIATSLDGITIPSNSNKNVKKLVSAKADNNKANSSISNLNQINNFKLTNLTNMNKLNKLCIILSNIFNKPVELDLTRLNAPFFDDNILVKLIGLVSTDLKPIKIFDSIYKNANIFNKRTADYNYSYSITRSFLAGIKIKIGGRLMTQRIVPKITTRHSQRGATATGKVTYSDWSRVTLKNKRGSHSITVTISHVI